ncbi:MAG: hypothetical protein ABIE47_05935 [Pseudomonadota bacterium]
MYKIEHTLVISDHDELAAEFNDDCLTIVVEISGAFFNDGFIEDIDIENIQIYDKYGLPYNADESHTAAIQALLATDEGFKSKVRQADELQHQITLLERAIEREEENYHGI